MDKMDNGQTFTIYDRISAIMENIGAIEKTHYNEAIKKNSRSKDDFLKAFQPQFATFGVVMTCKINSFNETTFASPSKWNPDRIAFRTTIHATFKFSCEDGSVETDVLSTKNDFNDFGAMAAMSLAMSRAMEIVFCVPTENPVSLDTPPIEASQPAGNQMIEGIGITIAQLQAIENDIEKATGDNDKLKEIWNSHPDQQSFKWFSDAIKAAKKPEEATPEAPTEGEEQPDPTPTPSSADSSASLEEKKKKANEALEKMPVRHQRTMKTP